MLQSTRFACYLLSSLFLLTFSCQKKDQQGPDYLVIDQILDTLLMEAEISSLSAGIIKGAQVYQIHKGQLLDGSVPNESSLYEIASLTKTFTGTLLANAIVENKINLEEDIRSYLVGEFTNLEYEGQAIKVANLATHQAGLPNMFPDPGSLFENPNFDKLPFQLKDLQEGFDKTAFLEALAKVKLDTTPGTRFAYSNTGANVLGFLLEQVYDEQYDIILQSKILGPLGMDNTHLRIRPDLDEFLVEGQNANKVKMPFQPEKYMKAEGGLMSNVGDMIKYMRYHLDVDDPVIAKSHQEMWSGQFGDFETGLFWQIFKDGDRPDKIYQNGGAYGTSSWITLIPELDIAIFLVTNTSGPNIHQKLSMYVDKMLAAI